MIRHTVPLSLALSLLVGCGSGDPGTDADAGLDPSTHRLAIEPADARLVVTDGQAVEQAYRVVLVDGDGARTDVTADAALQVARAELGSFDGAIFRPSGLVGGTSEVVAALGAVRGEAQVTVRVEDRRVVAPAPAEAPDWFDAAADDPALAPAIVYPQDGTLVPPNLGDFEAHWSPAEGTDLFEVTLRHELAEVRLYTAGESALAGLWAAFSSDEWSVLGATARGQTLELTVRALSSAAPERAGGQTLALALTPDDVRGGLYYWASTGSRPGGIYRHDMGRPGEPAEAFYTTDETPEGRCVACHVLSRDGGRMALTYDGGNGAASILDVATRAPVLATDGAFQWNFASFEPGADRLVTVRNGAMVLRDVDDGAVVADVPTAGWGTHPDFAPAGDALVYTVAAAASNDWTFTGGSVVARSFDAATASFGAPVTLAAEPGFNSYYPSFSPDGRWVIYSRSTEDAYDDASAEIWVVPADGSAAPQLLAQPNLGGGLTNSWARWAPFAQSVATGPGESEPLFWFTFSSKRRFGARLAPGTPQLWMAPFFPERAAAGEPASGPAFRLPFQDLGTNNHIAQWTEEVVPVERELR